MSDESNWMCYSRVGGDWRQGSELVGRGELTEEAWSIIAPLLPASERGGQWREHRTSINGILWKLRTGAPWRDLPERYGPWQTCADRLVSLASRHALREAAVNYRATVVIASIVIWHNS